MPARPIARYSTWALLLFCSVLAGRLHGADANSGEPAPRGVLSGRIVDESGEPVTDARVDLWPDRGGIILNANSDPDGRYYFLTVKNAGDYRIKITSRQCVGITKYDELPRVDLKAGATQVRDFTLRSACRMRMQIVDEQGKLLSGARVYHKLSTDKQYSSSESVSTDKLGWALLGGMEPSSAKRLFVAYHEGYAISQFSVTLDDTRTVAEEKVVLLNGEKVKGTVLCSDGKPAAGWTIFARPARWQFGVYLDPHKIGADGSFELSGIVPGEYDLVILVPTGQSSSTSKPVGSGVTLPPVDGTLALRLDYPSPESMAVISGKVTFEGGKPPDWINVTAQSSDKNNWLYFNIQTDKSDFELGPLPRGVYTLRFESSEIETKTLEKVTVPSDKLDLKLSIRKHPLLKGSVVRADTKQPVTDFRARVNRLKVSDGQAYNQEDSWREVKNTQGSFSLEVINSGIYTVQIAADGLAAVTSDPIDTSKESDKPLHVELGAGASLSGTVVDDEGRRIDGARVELLSMRPRTQSAARRESPPGSTTGTDRGKFTLDHLPLGQDTLKITHPEYCFALEKVTINANPSSEPLKIVLKRGGTVHGEVYDEYGQPKPNVTVYVHRQGIEGLYDWDGSERFEAVTDDNGHYELHHLPAQLCSVSRSDEWSEYAVVRQSILPADGKTQTLDLGGPTRLRGRLLVNGKPLEHAALSLSGDSPSSTLFRARARTNKDGTFTFRGMPPGGRTLYYTKSANQLRWIRVRQLKLTANGEDLGDIEAVAVKLIVRYGPLDEKNAEEMHVTLEEYDPIWARGNQAGTLLPRANPTDPFVIDGVPPGKYELICTPPNHFSVRKVIEVTASDPEQTFNLGHLQGSASLSGCVDSVITRINGYQGILAWSKDRQLFNIIRPKGDGSYRLENIPAGDYFLTRDNLRDPEILLTFSLGEGENKSLDLTPAIVATKRPPRAFATIRVFTPEGIPLPGCEISLEASSEKLTLSSVKDGGLSIRGPAGNYPIAIAFPGFQSLRRTIEIKPPEPDGAITAPEVNLYLQPSNP
jgi:protocatechuate 3,4-dioxygenase beta subunit